MRQMREYDWFELLNQGRVPKSLSQNRNQSRSVSELIEYKEERGLSLQEDAAFELRESIGAERPIEPPKRQPGDSDRVIAGISGIEARNQLGLPGQGEEREPVNGRGYE